MTNSLKGRSLASMKDLSPDELKLVLDTAASIKKNPAEYRSKFAGKTLARSIRLGGAPAGMHVPIIAPKGYQPKPQVLADSQAIAKTPGGSVTVSDDMPGAARGADVLYTDVWASMGQEAEAAARKKI